MKQKKTARARRGKLIIIEGADGTGKATQAELLIKYLKKRGVRVRFYDFPQYEKNFFGDMVARFLRGEYGKFKEVSPYLLTLPYALDRASVATEMRTWLAKGGWIVCNRYVTSHLAHQTAKMQRAKERTAFIKWDEYLEYEILHIPREDLVICLQVPHTISSKMNLRKGLRTYLKGMRKDLAEKDLSHQQLAGRMYTLLAQKRPHWRLVRCTDAHGDLMPIETIHALIVQLLKDTYGSI